MCQRLFAVALAIGLSLGGVGCGSGDGGGACDLSSTQGYCQSYTGSLYTGVILQSTESACKAGGGTWKGSCSTTDATGICTHAKGTANEIVVTYYKNKYPDATAAKAACDAGVGGNSTGPGEFKNP